MPAIYSVTTNAINVSSAPEDFLQIVNNSSSAIEIIECYAINTPSAALTGQSFTFEMFRLSASGTGTALTPVPFNTAFGACPTSIDVEENADFTTSGNPLCAGNLYTEEGANFMDKAQMYEYAAQMLEKPITLLTGEMIGITGNIRDVPGQAKFYLRFKIN